MNTVITQFKNNSEVSSDVFTSFARRRRLFITGFIEDKQATDISATLIKLFYTGPKELISLHINSDGGNIRNVLQVYDTMKFIRCPIETICSGDAMEESVLLLAAGTPGHRFITKNSSVCISSLSFGSQRHDDLVNTKIHVDQVEEDNACAMKILAKCTKKPLNILKQDCQRKLFMNAISAKKYGIVDGII